MLLNVKGDFIMRPTYVKVSVALSFLLAIIVFSLFLPNKLAKATVTEWFKIAPNTCTIRVDSSEDDRSKSEHGTWAQLFLDSSQTGTRSISAYCPVHVPDGAAMDLLRIRTFKSGGLPSNTDIKAYLRRVKWDGSVSTEGTADLDPGDSGDSVVVSETVDNENYVYYVEVYLYKNSSATTMPELEMIEIRYSI